jgi:tRNA (adenine37-N6)-methyltransferase
VTSQSLTIEPIGYVRTALKFKDEAPRQPRASGGAPGRIELLSGRNYEHALLDIEGWDHIWVLFWFHHNAGWRPKVLPPRSTSGRKGVFATRSPHRPNPIGLSAVRLERIEGLTLHVQDIDMLDGTPVLDLKPYVAYTDAIVDARNGWLDGNAGGAADPVAAFEVQWDEAAAEQATWVEARTSLPLRARVTSTLELGPEPQPYRRIRRDGEGFVLAVKEWRARFSVDGRRVRVHEIRSGYRDSQLSGASRVDANLSAHREFRGLQSQRIVAEPTRKRRGSS